MTWMDAVLLRNSLEATDQIQGETAFERLIQTARRSGLRVTTVTPGSAGFGPDGQWRRAAPFHFARNLPVTVELMDEEDSIDRVLDRVGSQLPAASLGRHGLEVDLLEVRPERMPLTALLENSEGRGLPGRERRIYGDLDDRGIGVSLDYVAFIGSGDADGP